MPEVVGYVYDGEYYCPVCVPDEDEADAIFDTSEFDIPLFCVGCETALGVSLTSAGYQEIAKWFIDSGLTFDEFREYMEERHGYVAALWVDDVVEKGFVKLGEDGRPVEDEEEEEPAEGEEEEGEPPVLMKMKRLHAILRKIVK
jgi:hypothetical protein